jgi:hypothetical protein
LLPPSNFHAPGSPTPTLLLSPHLLILLGLHSGVPIPPNSPLPQHLPTGTLRPRDTKPQRNPGVTPGH